MDARALLMTTTDGRDLDLELYGPDRAPLVLVQHGTPGGRTLPLALREAADAEGLRLAGWARPGYGRSARLPGRRVGDVLPDALAVAGALGAERFAVVGASGGGPHALAIGLSERCAGVATVASIAPWDAEGLDPLAGMGEGNLVEFDGARRGEAALRPLLEPWRAEVLDGRVEGVLQVLGSVLSPPDQAVLTGELATEVYAHMADGLAPGCDGWVDDDLAFVAPWGFLVDDVRAPVGVWQGGQDLMVPPAHGDWLAGHVTGAVAHLLPGDGHLTLQVTRAREILAPLAAALSSR